MKVSATALLLAAALGVSAHPSGHAHLHAHRGNVKRDFVIANKPLPSTTATPTPTPTSTPAVATSSSSSSSSSSGSGSSSGSAKPFCGGKSYNKRATVAEIAYQGNIGAEGDYGCNLMVVDEDVADDYDHIMTFENAAGDDQSCACWLKIGPDSGINGFFKGNQALNFDLPSNGKKVVAVDKNSQGGCACGSGGIPTTTFGEFASTWLEFDMANESNNNWSGADASCLVAAKFGLDIPGLKVCGHGTCSTINPGGTGDNAYLGGMEDEDGVGLNLNEEKVRLEITVGYQG